MINGAVKESGGTALEDVRLDKAFETHWPVLSKDLDEARKALPRGKKNERTDRALLEEILEHVRRAAQPPPNDDLPPAASLRDKYHALQTERAFTTLSPNVLATAADVVRSAGASAELSDRIISKLKNMGNAATYSIPKEYVLVNPLAFSNVSLSEVNDNAEHEAEANRRKAKSRKKPRG